MNQLNIIFGILSLLVINSNAFSQERYESIDSTDFKELSLAEAVRIGLENNYNLKIESNLKEIATRNVTLGNAGFLPTLDANASMVWSNEDVEQKFVSGDSQTRNGAKSNTLNASLDAEWVVFDGLGMFKRYDQLQQVEETAGYAWKNSVETTLLQIAEAYYNLRYTAEQLKVLRETLALSRSRITIASDKYEVGKTAKTELLTAETDYNADSSAYIQNLNLFQQAAIDLNLLLGKDTEVQYYAADSINTISFFSYEALKEDVLTKNSILKQAESNKYAASYGVGIIKSERFPRIVGFGSYGYSNFESQAGFLLSNQSTGFNYGVRASIPIFNGLNINRREQNAKIELDNAELSYEQVKLEVLADLDRTYSSYQRALALIELEIDNTAIAQENIAIAFDRYKLGRSTFLELREAQKNAEEAKLRLLDAAFAAKILELRLKRLSGNILEERESIN
ncbi:TolC family protein [Marinigracilibium pacificum]|uniref:TolC family protein n=1 Tax=Marinigracilibium pacificum TaxID=2729599 RepID=A0A848J150_9BACT|nr:TolC family protein [Marinigracilibium pacificum]NMM50287.1 TolC family protein [Marinigracilibium pacificum]